MTEKAIFGAGCFWEVEAEFRKVKGVVSTAVGYSGGWLKGPTYEDVCTARTGHAEVVEVEYDPAEVAYDQLLELFWSIPAPATLHRQGPGGGTQSRSAIFYPTPEQKGAAGASKKRLEELCRFQRPIVTEIAPATE